MGAVLDFFARRLRSGRASGAPNHARPLRSLAKTATWRIAASIDTFLLSLLITGSVAWAGSIASLEVLTKMALYYLHERAWAHVDWGVK